MLVGSTLIALVGLTLSSGLSFARDESHAIETLRWACTHCHRVDGKPEPHANLKGPDLTWVEGKFRPEASCWQPRRKIAKAPADFLAKINPLPMSADVTKAGETLFLKTAKPANCAICHGEQGDGKSKMSTSSVPPPRNFTCNSMMKDIPDGQLFWIIKNGSHGAPMISFAGLSDEEVWQLIHYIRSLAR
ncbi:c-type cytochrome [Candidatus Nitrotoga sp. M5]|uniref:c-type cytochrome n=1 Tax=Candidatus Nitrotoga sp. M5 TaxID=2890409 RepID=UPI001EF381AA|nr:c-type cytochrome [Candidatus Nitrotoga sp. M5]